MPYHLRTIRRNRKRAKISYYKMIQKLKRVWCEGSFGTMKIKQNLYMTYKSGIQKTHE
ncbi:hypothetical protein SAMN05443252_105159 [Bacillus sp. OV322]|nr:hypothetical protein SAMN05443252_105159 [Bacillus sp. OV322]